MCNKEGGAGAQVGLQEAPPVNGCTDFPHIKYSIDELFPTRYVFANKLYRPHNNNNNNRCENIEQQERRNKIQVEVQMRYVTLLLNMYKEINRKRLSCCKSLTSNKYGYVTQNLL